MLAAYALAIYRGADPEDDRVMTGALLEARFYLQFDALIRALLKQPAPPQQDEE